MARAGQVRDHVWLEKAVRSTREEGGIGSCLVTHQHVIEHRNGIATCLCPCHGHQPIVLPPQKIEDNWYWCKVHLVVTPGKSRCDLGLTHREMCELDGPHPDPEPFMLGKKEFARKESDTGRCESCNGLHSDCGDA